ncbi:helix-turn-helix transcriptional regulator [Deinococcus sp. Leaf326]|uniref:helix-turn-helix domain-containing protein n=1 Tax=Deinococcus sp. Leaf326 TaxID=1736338 RepID=UPI001F3C7B87|nr:helix-turn-helix transcriptional regulator [Deinococcus sp. Leaf326]
MNEKVRQSVKNTLKARDLTHQELADMTGIERANVTRLLSGTVGKVPDNWQKVLDALGMELIAVPKQES